MARKWPGISEMPVKLHNMAVLAHDFLKKPEVSKMLGSQNNVTTETVASKKPLTDDPSCLSGRTSNLLGTLERALPETTEDSPSSFWTNVDATRSERQQD